MRCRLSLLLLLGMVITLPNFSSATAAECAEYENYYHALGSFILPTNARDMEKEGSRLYLTGNQPEMLILDISDPLNMHGTGSCQLENPVWDLTVRSSIVYLLMYDNTLQLIDATDPDEPDILGSCALPVKPIDIALSGNYAYITAWTYGEPDYGLYVVDITNPLSPQLLGMVETGYYPGAITIQGDFAYVLSGNELLILDLSSPEEPALTGECVIPGDQRYVSVRDNYAYVVAEAEEWPADGDGLYIVNCSDPTSPWIEGQLAGDPEVIPNGPIALWEQYAILAHGYGLAFLDISDPASPSLAWYTATLGYSPGIIVDDGILFDCSYGLLNSYFLSESFTPEVIAEVPDTENAWCMRTAGDYCYAVQPWENMLKVIDMSNPENPVVVGSEEMGFTRAFGIALTEESSKTPLAFIGGSGDPKGFSIVDISDPADPRLIATVPLPFDTGEFDIEGHYLYIPADYGEIEIYDISNPLTPVFVDSMEFSFSISYIKVIDDTMYIGRRVGSHSAMFIVDVSDPHNPVLLGESDATRAPCEIVIREQYIHVADSSNGFLIFDASDPGNIELISRTNLGMNLESIEIVGDYAYLANKTTDSGVQVINISDPYNPVVVGYCQVDDPLELVYINGYLLAGCMHQSMTVIPLICETSTVDDFVISEPKPVMLEIAGNPSPGVCRLKLSLEISQSIELSVFDVQGRLVRHLYRGQPDAGVHELVWDGLNRNGVSMAEGVYFARLRFGNRNISSGPQGAMKREIIQRCILVQ